MLIGVDFDNTIVCYDTLFHRVAVEQGLIPPSVPATKSAVRGYLDGQGLPDVWTDLQGQVYGARMPEADAFDGVLEFFRHCVQSGLDFCIVSHKTRHPAIGPPHDLHEAARQWLERNGFFDPAQLGLPRNRVFFELTQQDKVDRIARVGCTHFIDDLPEVLTRAGFPPEVQRILFDPHRHHADDERLIHTSSWAEIERLIRCSTLPLPPQNPLKPQYAS
jgi:hypothetical protein